MGPLTFVTGGEREATLSLWYRVELHGSPCSTLYFYLLRAFVLLASTRTDHYVATALEPKLPPGSEDKMQIRNDGKEYLLVRTLTIAGNQVVLRLGCFTRDYPLWF